MTVRDDRLYLIHMLERIDRIVEYTRDGKAAFLGEPKTQDAVLRNLQTIAESSQRLSAGIKDKHPNLPWRDIAAFRNVVVHDYLGIDLERIWDIVERDLPALKSAIDALLGERPE